MGIIDQWGNGLKLIAVELKGYPEIDFKWLEKGLQFQLQFIKKMSKQSGQLELQPESQPESLFNLVLKALNENSLTSKEVSEKLGQKEISGQLRKAIRKLHEDGLIEQTIPDKSNHPNQRHKLSESGLLFLKMGSKK